MGFDGVQRDVQKSGDFRAGQPVFYHRGDAQLGGRQRIDNAGPVF